MCHHARLEFCFFLNLDFQWIVFPSYLNLCFYLIVYICVCIGMCVCLHVCGYVFVIVSVFAYVWACGGCTCMDICAQCVKSWGWYCLLWLLPTLCIETETLNLHIAHWLDLLTWSIVCCRNPPVCALLKVGIAGGPQWLLNVYVGTVDFYSGSHVA